MYRVYLYDDVLKKLQWKVDLIHFGTTNAGHNLTGLHIKFDKDQKTIFVEANREGGST